MAKPLRELVVRLLKVPPEPDPPAGSRESVRVFRASRKFYWYRLGVWTVKQAGALAGLLVFIDFDPLNAGEYLPSVFDTLAARFDIEISGLEGPVTSSIGLTVYRLLELVGLATFLVQLPLTYSMVRLDYELRWYIVTDRSLRIRYGVGRVREMTMTFANIQNLSIEQGPLQRLLGISDLRVRSAGGGDSESSGDGGDGGGGRDDSMHVGYFRGVDNAGEIRDVVIERLKRLQDAGLGDPEERRRAPAPAGAELAAARRLVDEARALRAAFERGRPA